MRTSKEHQKCLKEGIVTTEMLSLAIFSCNKRAKNMRDQEREYRYHPVYRKKYHDSKEEYYGYKEELLNQVQPCEIHIVERVRWEIDFYGEEVRRVITEKYLFYIVGDKSFHSPLPKDNEKEYKHLPIVHLDDLQTFGEDPKDLPSVQMAKKILNGLRDGSLRYVGNDPIPMAA